MWTLLPSGPPGGRSHDPTRRILSRPRRGPFAHGPQGRAGEGQGPHSTSHSECGCAALLLLLFSHWDPIKKAPAATSIGELAALPSPSHERRRPTAFGFC